MVEKTEVIFDPSAWRTKMAVTEMNAKINAYSTRVWPLFAFLVFLLLMKTAAFLLECCFVIHGIEDFTFPGLHEE